jgi:hypothetical protein
MPLNLKHNNSDYLTQKNLNLLIVPSANYYVIPIGKTEN